MPALALVLCLFPAGQAFAQDAREPARAEETVTVTATRRPFAIADLAAPVVSVSGTSLRGRAAVGLDEALRWTPQVSLLRRTPARAAHPTTQGLNLRGVAPSGTSRALVLIDGLPLTDAFGGWVYWSRVPPLMIEAVEIAPGGGSATFGNQSLAGTLQIVTRNAPDELRAATSLSAGNLGSYRLGGFVGGALGNARLIGAIDVFSTAGYVATAAADRGPVDTKVGSSHQLLWLRAQAGAAWRLGGDLLREERQNGTPEQTNRTVSGGLQLAWESGSDRRGVAGRAQARWQEFESRFSRIGPDRVAEVPVLDQVVPAREAAVSVQGWTQPGVTSTVAAGVDWRHVSGTSEELILTIDRERAVGGNQNVGGLFVAAQVAPAGGLFLEAALRGDLWRNQELGDGPARSLSALSPRVGGAWRVAPAWTLRAAGYRSFRAPTLNELYRQFRVGNVVTLANPDLEAEHLWGAEAGIEHQYFAGDIDLTARVQAYVNELSDAIVNATLDTGPSLILRRRDNVGRARIRGIEGALQAGIGAWRLDATAVWIDARFSDSGAGRVGLAGRRLPHVPTYRARISASWGVGKWSALAALHATGPQFEDERNTLRLGAATTADLLVGYRVTDALEADLGVQNLFDSAVEVRRSSVLTLGPPATVSARLRWSPSQ